MATGLAFSLPLAGRAGVGVDEVLEPLTNQLTSRMDPHPNPPRKGEGTRQGFVRMVFSLTTYDLQRITCNV